MESNAPTGWEPLILWHLIGFKPHWGQHEVLYKVDQALRKVGGAQRFLDLATGRQWGKTTAAETALWMGLTQPDDSFGPPTIKVIADKYEHANLIWDRLVNHLFSSDVLRELLRSYNKERELITLKSGATVQKLSADNPQAMTGYTLSMAIVDEAAFVSDESIEMLLPSLAVRQGVVLAFGTAEGVGWHRAWFLKGQDQNFQDHWSATYSSTDNPFFPPEELRTQEIMLPRRRFEQLYLARWQTEEGSVFHNVENCILKGVPLSTPPEKGRKYVIGADFGRHLDYTVAYVGDARTGRVLHEERFHAQDWTLQVERITDLAKRYNNADVICDATGVGDAVVSMLNDRGVSTVGVVMTPSVKEKLINKLVLALEREEIRFPEYDELVRELMVYEVIRMPGGRDKTGAPVGYHDDCSIALALLNDGILKGYGGREQLMEEKFGWQL